TLCAGADPVSIREFTENVSVCKVPVWWCAPCFCSMVPAMFLLLLAVVGTCYDDQLTNEAEDSSSLDMADGDGCDCK
ncbi:hypothetical protein GBAR_LOCUS20794, partial [Geodia barretti]